MLRTLDLFSGIGGFSLGLERTGGFETVAFCEIDPFCRRVLAKHWPDVPCFEDITKLTKKELDAIGKIDVICGGFPCQPVSCAGKRQGDKDKRWLWPEFYRIVCEVKPRWVLVENVPGLLSADSGRLFAGILRDLASSGYDAEWNIVSAASVGAPHLRKRVFVVAHAGRWKQGECSDPDKVSLERNGSARSTDPIGGSGRDERTREDVADSTIPGQLRNEQLEDDSEGERGRRGFDTYKGGQISSEDASNAKIQRLQESEGRCGSRTGFPGSECDCFSERGTASDGPIIGGLGIFANGISSRLDNPWRPGWEDGTPRIATGVKDRVNRLRALGNAIVPQCSQYVGQCILEAL
jgi:DNA (cytosine-5)-methyltransferase 1